MSAFESNTVHSVLVIPSQNSDFILKRELGLSYLNLQEHRRKSIAKAL
jgi:hypothetical protein